MLSQLPIELLNLIFGYLVDDRRGADGFLTKSKSLKACTLTCKAFLAPARAYLLRSLYATDAYSTQRTLRYLFEGFEHYMPFVRHLELEEHYTLWLESEASRHVLGLLSPYITSIGVMRGHRHDNGRPRFQLPSLGLLKRVQDITLAESYGSCPYLRHSDIALPSLLNQFPQLHTLKLDGLGVMNRIPPNARPMHITTPSFKLQTFVITFCHDEVLLHWLIPAIVGLQTLEMCIPDNSHPLRPYDPVLEDFITTSSKSLQNLRIHGLNTQHPILRDDSVIISIMSKVRQCTSLLSLELAIIERQDNAECIICRCLGALEALPSLQRLVIKYHLNDDFNSDLYAQLQTLLVGGGFPSLKSLQIKLTRRRLAALRIEQLRPSAYRHDTYLEAFAALRQERRVRVEVWIEDESGFDILCIDF